MFNPILVPLDGSQVSECVFPHIVGIARSFDAEITLLRVLEKNPTNTPVQLFDLLNWQINKKKATLYLDKIKAQMEETGLRVLTVVLDGLVAEGISAYAQNQGMNLVVLSSHGSGGLTHRGISSITQKIVQSAPTSLLIVRAQQYGASFGELSESSIYKRILVPLDGSQRAENVLPIIARLAHFHKSQIHLAQVVQTPEMVRQMPAGREDVELSQRVVERNREEAEKYLERVQSHSYLKGITVKTHLICTDHAAIALHKLEDQDQIDMVIMSAHGYSGINIWPYGSMVNSFILYGKVPLLIVQDLPAKQQPASSEITSSEPTER
jgi:nucleotide-binding universal stress UspA family protein